MAPDDERLGRLIGAAFEQLPEPVPARLKAVEDRLALDLARREKRSGPGRYWWLMAALVASGAAAWWSGGTWWRPAPDAKPTPVETETLPSAQQATTLRSDKERDAATMETDRNRTPTIYRRERH